MIRRLIGFFGVLGVSALVALSAAPAGASTAGVTATGGSSVGSSAASGKASFVWIIQAHGCPAFNKASIRVQQRENGTSGTNYFQQVAQGQVLRGGFWQNRGNRAVQRSTQFPNDFRTFFFNGPNWVFTWNSEFAFSHRVLVTLQWWNNAGTPNFFGDDFKVFQRAVFNRCT
jgi:hypothetical protein